MAIKISGTNVIDDSRNVVNVNSIIASSLNVVPHLQAAFDKANTAGGGYYLGNNGAVGPAAGLQDIFRVHANTLTANITITTGNNALASGPITISANRTLTIQANARVSIV